MERVLISLAMVVSVNGQSLYFTNPALTDVLGQSAIYQGVISCGDTFQGNTYDGRHLWRIDFTHVGRWMEFSLCDNRTSFDSGITIWEQDPLLGNDHFRFGGSNNNFCGLKSRYTLYDWWVDPDHCYYFHLGGFLREQGNYFLSVTCDPGSSVTINTTCNEDPLSSLNTTTEFPLYSSSYLVPPDVSSGRWDPAINQGSLWCGQTLQGNIQSSERHFWRVYHLGPSIIDFSLCNPGTDFDSGISVWEDYQGSYHLFAWNDDSCGNSSFLRVNTSHLNSFSRYFFQLGGNQEHHGNYELSVHCTFPATPSPTFFSHYESSYLVPPNESDDRWAPAIFEGLLSCNDPGNLDETRQDEERHLYAIMWPIPEWVQTITFSTCGSNFTKYDTGISLWFRNDSGDYFSGLSNDNHCGLASQITFNADTLRDSGGFDSFLLIVGGYLDRVGEYRVVMQCTGDEATSTTGSFIDEQSNFLVPPDVSDPYGEARYRGMIQCGDVLVGETSENSMRHFYQINLNGQGATHVRFSLCSDDTQFDTGLSLWERSLQGFSEYKMVGSNDDFCELQSQLTHSVQDMSDQFCHYILVGGYASNVGPYRLVMECVEGDPLNHPQCDHPIETTSTEITSTENLLENATETTGTFIGDSSRNIWKTILSLNQVSWIIIGMGITIIVLFLILLCICCYFSCRKHFANDFF